MSSVSPHDLLGIIFYRPHNVHQGEYYVNLIGTLMSKAPMERRESLANDYAPLVREELLQRGNAQEYEGVVDQLQSFAKELQDQQLLREMKQEREEDLRYKNLTELVSKENRWSGWEFF